MSTNKLDYLNNKYTSNTTKKKKKKKKKTKRSRSNGNNIIFDNDNYETTDTTALIDSTLSIENHNTEFEYDKDDEDGPVIVENVALSRHTDERSTEKGVNKRKYYDSDDDDSYHSKEKSILKHSTRKRYDSDDDNDDNDKHAASRKRYDSDDEEDNKKNGSNASFSSSSSRQKQKKGRRCYDSDDDDSDEGQNGAQDDKEDNNNDTARHRNSSQRRRRLYDSDDDSNDQRRRKRSRSSSRSSRRHSKQKRKQQRRYNSDDDDSQQQRRRQRRQKVKNDSTKLMKSGHSAGLHNIDKFRQEEMEIQKQKKHDTKNKTDNHHQEETIYRDSKTGKKMKLNVENQQNQSIEQKKQQKWENMGTIQKRQMEERVQQELQPSSFARTLNDVDDWKKHTIRDGDPMMSTARSNKTARQANQKPVYKGPQGKPNRYSIPPGYRWDGIDRGNGFEDLVLAQLYAKGRKDEEAYKWSCADM